MPDASINQPVWMTSSELIGSARSIRRIDGNAIDAVLERLSKSTSMIQDYIETYVRDSDVPVHLHEGDLNVDGSFLNEHVLIVDGRLTIRGSYDDYTGDTGVLVVFGDMHAEHVVSRGSIAITGTLQATGLVYTHYPDFTFEVAGTVKARALVVSDKSASCRGVDAPIVQMDDRDDTVLALQHFVPEVMIENILDTSADLEGPLHVVASYEAVKQRVADGRPIFRHAPGAKSLAADVRRVLASASEVDGATMGRLAKADALLAMVIATRASVPLDVQEQLAASGDATILERLAANPQTGGVVLGLLAGSNAATAAIAASVARHPNAPPDALASLAGSADPAVRMSLLEHPRLPAAALSRLAADTDADVRKALATGRHLRRLPPEDLARLIADLDAGVRAELPGHDALLSVEQLSTLARDTSPEVREAVARALSAQALWQQVPAGAADAGAADTRAALIATLLQDAVAAVRFAALPGVSATGQEEFIAGLPVAERSRVEAEIASSTRSETLMMRAADGDVPNAIAVAGNPAITPAVQRRLMARLPDAATRPRVSILDDPELSATLSLGDAVIDGLVQNPNATPETLLAAATYCRITKGDASFCSSLGQRTDLAADVLEILDEGTIGADQWARSVLESHHATRAQIERAVPQYHSGEREILRAAYHLLELPDDAWWHALATSEQPKLREIAAANAATPASMLVTLLSDPEDGVRNLAPGNPSTPVEAFDTEAFDAAGADSNWMRANPRLPDTLLHRLLDRALVAGDDDAVHACKEILAARVLRASP